jgi:lipopolysaccharide export system permease protein
MVTFMIAMFIFEMQFIWVYLDEMMGKGLGMGIILKLLFYASARVVNMALPLAILMSSIMTMGALAENNELTAMKSAGTSLLRILRPLALFSVGLSLTAFLFANNLWPVANLKFRTILFNVMKQKPSLSLMDGVFYSGIDGISIRAMRNNKETGELEDVLIYDHRDGQRGNRTVIRAEKGLMEQTEDKRYLVLTLWNGHSYDEQRDKKKKDPQYANLHGAFEKNILRIDLSSLSFSADNEEQMKKPEELMTVHQLDEAIDSLKLVRDTIQQRLALNNLRGFHFTDRANKNDSAVSNMLFDLLLPSEKQKAITQAKENARKSKDAALRQSDEIKGHEKRIQRHKIEWHRKFYLAVVCLVLFFVGAPLGAIIRKGGIGLPTLIALGIFIAYILLTMAGENMAKHGIIAPWIGIWMSTAVFFPLAIWLTYKAVREATLFDKETYSNWLKKLFLLMKPKVKTQV